MKKLFLSIFLILLVVPFAFSLDLKITPGPDDTSADSPQMIPNSYCGQDTAPMNFKFNNNGDFGVLCWYYVNGDQGTLEKLTPSCMGPNSTDNSYYLDLPVSLLLQSGSLKINLECFDFGEWQGFNPINNCQDSTTYTEANKPAVHFSKGSDPKESGQYDVWLVPRYADIDCILPDFSLTSDRTSLSLKNSESATVNVTIHNSMDTSLNCSVKENGSWVSKGTVSGKGDLPFEVEITAPSTGEGTYSHTVMVQCEDPSQGGYPNEKSIDITVNYASEPIDFSLGADRTSLSMINGEETTITVTISNAMDNSLDCSYKIDDSWNSVGSVSASGEKPFSVKITAPSSGEGTKSYPISVKCEDPSQGGLTGDSSISVTVEYSADPVKTAIESANGMISNAEEEIESAEAKIEEAQGLGADVTNAENKLNEAKSHLDTAKSQKDNAESTNSESEANKAYNSAETAKTQATQALNEANSAIQEIQQCLEDANNLIDDAKMAIKAAEDEIERADEVATVENLSTDMANAVLEGARGNLSDAENFLENAKSAFQTDNCESAKTNANTAISRAQKAEQDAEVAAENLASKEFIDNFIGSELKNKNEEIMQADDTYIKLTQVVREMRKYEEVTETLESIDEQKAKIDQAKDLHSQAENKFKVGNYEEAAEKMMEAGDTAASAQNKLDRITENLRYTILDALDAAKSSAQTEIGNSNQTIENASKTYGSTTEKIVEAQEDIKTANLEFNSASNLIEQARASASLSEFLEKSAAAFETINEVKEKTEEATEKANSAATDATVKTAGAVAAAVGAAGGGYLFWRRRKKRKKGEKAGEKTGIIKGLKEKHPEEVEWQKKGDKLKKELKEITNKLHELDEKLVDGKISKEEHDKKKKKLEDRKAEILKKL